MYVPVLVDTIEGLAGLLSFYAFTCDESPFYRFYDDVSARR
jgi:hypothetical protein